MCVGSWICGINRVVSVCQSSRVQRLGPSSLAFSQMFGVQVLVSPSSVSLVNIFFQSSRTCPLSPALVPVFQAFMMSPSLVFDPQHCSHSSRGLCLCLPFMLPLSVGPGSCAVLGVSISNVLHTSVLCSHSVTGLGVSISNVLHTSVLCSHSVTGLGVSISNVLHTSVLCSHSVTGLGVSSFSDICAQMSEKPRFLQKHTRELSDPHHLNSRMTSFHMICTRLGFQLEVSMVRSAQLSVFHGNDLPRSL